MFMEFRCDVVIVDLETMTLSLADTGVSSVTRFLHVLDLTLTNKHPYCGNVHVCLTYPVAT